MPLTIQFRPATVEDLETLRTLALQAFWETFGPLNTPENMEAYVNSAYEPTKLRGELEDPDQEFYFAYADGVLAGYLKVNEAPSQSEFNDSDALELERIYVLQRFYGTGVGQFLMDAAVRMARERGKAYIFLGVWEYNRRARRFYEKNGFYRIGEHIFVMGDDPQTDFLLRKDLK